MRRNRTRLIALIAALATLACGAGAAERDDARAALERGEFATAMRLYKPLAEQGDAAAQSSLALMYRRGLGVPVDFAAAAAWYRKAAEQGDAGAQNALGRLYGAGLGVAKDYVAAVEWYAKAAAQGAAEHQFDLAVMYDNGLGVAKDSARAAQWYARAAAQGLADAEASLGVLYQQGSGVPEDAARAFELYSRAADKGHARAQNNLGLLYTRGEGVAQDYAAAVTWFRKAAEQGLHTAMTNLGVMYANGFGVKQDQDEAAHWYRLGGRQGPTALDQIAYVYDGRLAPLSADARTRAAHVAAANGGDPIAQFILGYVHSSGAPAERDFRAAARWYRKAADKSYAPAMTNLGLLYIRGLGVPQDYVLGYMWINLAAASGLAEAVTVRDTVAAHMTPAQVNEAQQLASRRWRESAE
jgi:uncharacterized protein